MNPHQLWSKINNIFQYPNDKMLIHSTKSYRAITMCQALCKEPRDTQMKQPLFHDMYVNMQESRKARVTLRHKFVWEAIGDKRRDRKF